MNRESGIKAPPGRSKLDDPEGLYYSEYREGAADRRFAPPVRYEKVTAKFGDLGRLLFLYHLDNQRGVSRPCHLQK